MDTPTPSNDQHSLLLSIIWVITMTLIYLAIRRRFEAYLNPRARESLDHATLIATVLSEVGKLEKRLDKVEGGLLELGPLVMQAHDKVPRSPEINEMHASRCEQMLELGRKIIHAHDTVLSMSPKIWELHAAQCTLTAGATPDSRL
jgi:ADP-dependent phosphofructokinase/glucokinase